MKLFVIIALCSALPALAQHVPGRHRAIPVAADEPTMFMTVGVGASTFSDPRYGMTGAIGKRIAEGTFATVALDAGYAVDAVTGQRKSVTRLRPGLQKILAQSGPITLSAAGDVGGTVQPGSIVGQVSGGGAIAYTLPKRPNVFLYGSLRLLKSPQSDPSLSNPAIVQTAFSFGVGFKLK
jgi:hypothetical protein